MNINIKSKYNKGELLYYCYIPSDNPSSDKFPFVYMDIKYIDTVTIVLKDKTPVITYKIISLIENSIASIDNMKEDEVEKGIRKKVIFTNIKDWEKEIKYKTNAVVDVFKGRRINFLKEKINRKFGG